MRRSPQNWKRLGELNLVDVYGILRERLVHAETLPVRSVSRYTPCVHLCFHPPPAQKCLRVYGVRMYNPGATAMTTAVYEAAKATAFRSSSLMRKSLRENQRALKEPSKRKLVGLEEVLVTLRNTALNDSPRCFFPPSLSTCIVYHRPTLLLESPTVCGLPSPLIICVVAPVAQGSRSGCRARARPDEHMPRWHPRRTAHE